MRRVNIHATCVALGELGKHFGAAEDDGVLLLGESGSGKSDLALRLIERGAALVADDCTELWQEAGVLCAGPPSTIAGMLEVRGVGIVRLPHLPKAKIALAVSPASGEEIPRLPEIAAWSPPHPLVACRVPHFRLSPYEQSTPAKIALAAAALAQNLFVSDTNKP